ncbi:MAG TPA: Ig-like domain-containing protein [Thermoanaerobaculia bacterium]|nr:Ig-like domain-containing protein [Thermoanaerobaculia bacterium]
MTDEDTPLVITLTGADVDGDSLTFAIATVPSNGGLSAITPIDATSAQVTYTPNANFFGATVSPSR